MPNRTVSQARSFKQNPNHYPRKLKVGIYNALTRTESNYPLIKNPKRILIQCQEKIGDGILLFPLLYGLKLFLRYDFLMHNYNVGYDAYLKYILLL